MADAEEEQFEVEKLINDAFIDDLCPDKGRLWLVKWRGYGDEHNTWEPRAHLEHLGVFAKYERSKGRIPDPLTEAYDPIDDDSEKKKKKKKKRKRKHRKKKKKHRKRQMSSSSDECVSSYSLKRPKSGVAAFFAESSAIDSDDAPIMPSTAMPAPQRVLMPLTAAPQAKPVRKRQRPRASIVRIPKRKKTKFTAHAHAHTHTPSDSALSSARIPKYSASAYALSPRSRPKAIIRSITAPAKCTPKRNDIAHSTRSTHSARVRSAPYVNTNAKAKATPTTQPKAAARNDSRVVMDLTNESEHSEMTSSAPVAVAVAESKAESKSNALSVSAAEAMPIRKVRRTPITPCTPSTDEESDAGEPPKCNEKAPPPASEAKSNAKPIAEQSQAEHCATVSRRPRRATNSYKNVHTRAPSHSHTTARDRDRAREQRSVLLKRLPKAATRRQLISEMERRHRVKVKFCGELEMSANGKYCAQMEMSGERDQKKVIRLSEQRDLFFKDERIAAVQWRYNAHAAHAHGHAHRQRKEYARSSRHAHRPDRYHHKRSRSRSRSKACPRKCDDNNKNAIKSAQPLEALHTTRHLLNLMHVDVITVKPIDAAAAAAVTDSNPSTEPNAITPLSTMITSNASHASALPLPLRDESNFINCARRAHVDTNAKAKPSPSPSSETEALPRPPAPPAPLIVQLQRRDVHTRAPVGRIGGGGGGGGEESVRMESESARRAHADDLYAFEGALALPTDACAFVDSFRLCGADIETDAIASEPILVTVKDLLEPENTGDWFAIDPQGQPQPQPQLDQIEVDRGRTRGTAQNDANCNSSATTNTNANAMAPQRAWKFVLQRIREKAYDAMDLERAVEALLKYKGKGNCNRLLEANVCSKRKVLAKFDVECEGDSNGTPATATAEECYALLFKWRNERGVGRTELKSYVQDMCCAAFACGGRCVLAFAGRAVVFLSRDACQQNIRTIASLSWHKSASGAAQRPANNSYAPSLHIIKKYVPFHRRARADAEAKVQHYLANEVGDATDIIHFVIMPIKDACQRRLVQIIQRLRHSHT